MYVKVANKNKGKLYLAALMENCMKTKFILMASVLFLALWACNNDDDGVPGEVVPPKTVGEAAADDDAAIKAFLQTHFYNYEEFENPASDFDFKIRFDTIAGDNADKTPIANRPELKTTIINVDPADWGRDEGAEVAHNLYYLVVREGEGESPTIGDNVALQYEGSLLTGTLFDGVNTPTLLYMSGVVRGYGNGVVKFKAGTSVQDNGDGTVQFEGYGIGAIFIPSGLAYFNSPQGSIIPAYAPLIFKVDVLAFQANTDFDGDGIPSILEDVNGDGNLNNDNTDTDTESLVFLANHNDTDDDADGIPTIEEINLNEDGTFLSFKDTDGDGVPDHLDPN